VIDDNTLLLKFQFAIELDKYQIINNLDLDGDIITINAGDKKYYLYIHIMDNIVKFVDENEKITKYNKLIRDNIPEIIKADGEIHITQILDDEEFKYYLDKKLQEEVNEYLKISKDLNIDSSYSEKFSETDELIDIAEVLYTILEYRNIPIEKFEKYRLEKRNKKGYFKSRILLKDIITKEREKI